MMLCERIDELPKEPSRYLTQIKYDGNRAVWDGRIVFRSGHIRSDRYPQIVKELKGINCELDGEIVVFDEDVSNFNHGQKKENWIKAVYMVFDILSKNGENLRNKPVEERYKILTETIRESEHIKVCPLVSLGDIKKFEERGEEGVVIKRLGSRYEDRRSHSWNKFKFFKTTTANIIGFDKGTGYKGAVITDKGKVGLLTPELKEFYLKYKPSIVRVEYLEMTADNKMRMPKFKEFIMNSGGVM